MDSPPELERWLDGRRPLVETRLSELIPRPSLAPATLHEAMRYAVLGGGKRLRPLLCLAAYEATGGSAPRGLEVPDPPENGPDCPGESAPQGRPALSAASTQAIVAVYGSAPVTPAAALDVACAMEIMHAYSLIHDDLPSMDNDDLRRGRLTVHKAFGEATALLAGDALMALSFGVLATALPPGRCRLGVILLAQASGSMGLCGGQMLDWEGESQPVTPERVVSIGHWKTGSLFSAACEAGALAADADAARRKAVAGYGRHAGAAFQAVDDLLDITGSAQRMGKQVGKDRRRNKQTWVAAEGLEAARGRVRAETALALESIATLGPRGRWMRMIAESMVTRNC